MPYSITYEPMNHISGVEPKTVARDTAIEAWALVQQLNASDEKTTIKDGSGRPIEWQELRRLAERDSN